MVDSIIRVIVGETVAGSDTDPIVLLAPAPGVETIRLNKMKKAMYFFTGNGIKYGLNYIFFVRRIKYFIGE